MSYKPVTFETMIADQRERIERNNAKDSDNVVMAFINEINNELPKHH